LRFGPSGCRKSLLFSRLVVHGTYHRATISLKRLPKNNDLLQVADLQANKILATYIVL
jgi:hypothetical protein